MATEAVGLAVARGGEAIKTEVTAILANLVSLIKMVLMYVYEWMMRFWSWFSENPIGGVTFLANVYVLME